MARLGTDDMIKFILFGLVILWGVMQVIDLSAIGTGDPIVKDPIADDIAIQAFIMVILAIAVYITWKVTGVLEGQLNRRKLITLVLMGIALYVLYVYVVQPLLCAQITGDCPLPELFQSAARLKMAFAP